MGDSDALVDASLRLSDADAMDIGAVLVSAGGLALVEGDPDSDGLHLRLAENVTVLAVTVWTDSESEADELVRRAFATHLHCIASVYLDTLSHNHSAFIIASALC